MPMPSACSTNTVTSTACSMMTSKAQPPLLWQGSWLLCESPRTSFPITCLFSKVQARQLWALPTSLSWP
uniref:Alternative protein ME3 n=1 Tax=Homo sapiens TaxID=9606 RepID=L8ECD3_HUMAN|nr:alternative protein ME3 [Homo sapiens]